MPLIQLIVALLDIHEVDVQGSRVILMLPSPTSLRQVVIDGGLLEEASDEVQACGACLQLGFEVQLDAHLRL